MTDTLTASGAWGLADGGPIPAGMSSPAGEASGAYFDAESVLGSMRQSLPNTVSCSCMAFVYRIRWTCTQVVPVT